MDNYSVLRAPWVGFHGEAGGFQWLNSISEFIPSDNVQRICQALDAVVVEEFEEEDLESLTQLVLDKIHHTGLPAFLAWIGESACESTLRILAKLGELPAEVIDAVDGVLGDQAADDTSSEEQEDDEAEDEEGDEDAATEADEPQTPPVVNPSNVQPPTAPTATPSISTPNTGNAPPKKE